VTPAGSSDGCKGSGWINQETDGEFPESIIKPERRGSPGEERERSGKERERLPEDSSHLPMDRVVVSGEARAGGEDAGFGGKCRILFGR
jgi:hypothetical protein